MAGTTGYDALHQVDGLFADPAGASQLLGRYRRFAAPQADRGGHWGTTVRRAAYKVVTHELATEVDRLTRVVKPAVRRLPDPALRDHAPWALGAALRELLVRMEVYRPYPSTDASLVVTERAADEARAAFTVPEEAHAVDVVRDLVLGRGGDGPEGAEFRARFAQTSSALRAKSVEDTAFYRYVPLLSANEVGGDPGRPAVSPEDFHAYCARVQRDWPVAGTVLSTHDTKRSADVRAAVSVLSQCPDRWSDVLEEVSGEGAGMPDPQVAWAAWQTVFGLGPAEEAVTGDGDAAGSAAAYEARVQDALLKHVREAGDAHRLDGAGPRLRGRGGGVRGRGAVRASRAARGRLPRLTGAARPGERPRGRSGPSDDARGAGRVPGDGGRVPGAGRPGQPGAFAPGTPPRRRWRSRWPRCGCGPGGRTSSVTRRRTRRCPPRVPRPGTAWRSSGPVT